MTDKKPDPKPVSQPGANQSNTSRAKLIRMGQDIDPSTPPKGKP